MSRRVTLPYSPRRWQAEVHQRLRRFSVLVCHRRAGKTILAVYLLVACALRAHDQARYGYVAPTFIQAKDIAWEYLKRAVAEIPGMRINESELWVQFPNGPRVRLYGAENPDRMRGLAFDGVVLDEPEQQPARLWGEILRPALADRKGWALWIGTPAGKDEFFRLYEQAQSDPEWYAGLYRWQDTDALPPEEIEAARRTMSAAQFRQEFECDFSAPVEGAYYADELDQAQTEGRISRGVWEPGAEVHTAWDLGIGDATSILWWQTVGREPRIVDAYSTAGQGLAHYVEVLKAKPYTHGTHYLPHDAGHKQLGDHAGRSLAEQLTGYGIAPVEVLPRADVEPGIEAVRQLLRTLWIDSDKCASALDAWRAYRREWDDRNRVWRPKPKHDWASHYADALRYVAAAHQERKGGGLVDAPRIRPPSFLEAGVGWMS